MNRRVFDYAVPVLAGLLLVLLAMGYDRAREVRWQGGYIVTVTTKRTSNRLVSKATYSCLFGGAWAAVKDRPEEWDVWDEVTVTDGGTFIARVRTGGRDSGLGLRNTSGRQTVLLVKVVYADGGSHLVVADIPEKRGGVDPEMTIEVP